MMFHVNHLQDDSLEMPSFIFSDNKINLRMPSATILYDALMVKFGRFNR